MRIGPLIVVCLVASSALWAGAGAQDFSSLMAEGDAAWERRGTDGDPDNQNSLDFYRAAVNLSPFSYEAHWKTARSLWWISDQAPLSPGNKGPERDRGKEGMSLAERAVLIRPDGVEGHLYFSLSALHYTYGTGIVDALKEGVQDEVLKHLVAAYERDKTYERGVIPRTLSAFYRTAPWPLRDRDKALTFSREALALDPAGVRTAVFGAACLESTGMHDRAMELLRKASEMEGDRNLEPDCKRWKRFAARCVDEGRVIDPDGLF